MPVALLLLSNYRNRWSFVGPLAIRCSLCPATSSVSIKAVHGILQIVIYPMSMASPWAVTPLEKSFKNNDLQMDQKCLRLANLFIRP